MYTLLSWRHGRYINFTVVLLATYNCEDFAEIESPTNFRWSYHVQSPVAMPDNEACVRSFLTQNALVYWNETDDVGTWRWRHIIVISIICHMIIMFDWNLQWQILQRLVTVLQKM